MSFGDNIIRYHPVYKGESPNFYVETTINTNEVVHLVGVYDGNVAKLYVNSHKVGEKPETLTADIPADKKVIFIGCDVRFPRFFKGEIYGVRIYNRALSPVEIAQNYFATTPESC
jgi:hypothetical protein